MPAEKVKNSDIKKYLLGLSDGDGEIIEESLLVDDEFYENFLSVEEELIQEYVDDELTSEEKKQFESHFLISEERFQKVKFAQSLRKHIDQKETTRKAETTKSETQKSKSINFFSNFFSSPIPLAVSLLVVVALMWGIFSYFGSNSLSPLEKEFAELNKGDFNDVGKYANLSRLNLISGVTRGSNGFGKLSKKNLTNKVLFRLALPTKTESERDFKIELLKTQKIIFMQNRIRVYKNEGGEELRFFLPTDLLKKGEYQIKAMDNSKQDEEIIYSFLIE